MAFLNNGTMVSNEQFFQTIENYFISDTSPERTLFLAVILQALLDATQKDTRDIESSRYKREAVLWFTTKFGEVKKNFDYVCGCANIEPSYMRRIALEILNSKRTSFIRGHINAILTHRDSYDRIRNLNNKQNGVNHG